MLKKEFVERMWADSGENAGTEVNDRDPTIGGLLDREEFRHALQSVNCTREEKEKGVARMKTQTDKPGSWKSNEFKKWYIQFKQL